MHGTAKTTIEPVFPSENFRKCTVQKEITGQTFYIVSATLFFNNTETIPTKKLLHDGKQAVIIEFTDC